MLIRLSCLSVFLLYISACQTPIAEEQPVEFEDVFQASSPIYLYGFNEPPGDDSSGADFTAIRSAFSLWHMLAESSDLSADEAMETVRRALAEKEERHRAIAAQALGVMLLDHHLADGELTTASPDELAQRTLELDDQEMIGLAVELLVENGNPNADLIAGALNTLDGFWDVARIQLTAEAAEHAARSAIDSPSECIVCSTTEATHDRADDIERGIAKLRLVSSQ